MNKDTEPKDINWGRCLSCEKVVNERCGDNYCRPCHKSLTFEDCISGAWLQKIRQNIEFT